MFETAGRKIRLRSKAEDSSNVTYRDNERKAYKENRHPSEFPNYFASVLLVFFLGLYGTVSYLNDSLPPALSIQDEPDHAGSFIEERARNHLILLTSMGPRPTGSYENEVLAVDFLMREINFIKQRAKPVHQIYVDVQKPVGSFKMSFVDGMTSYYARVQNIIVKLTSEESSSHSVLINCHFDSVPGSSGASDDGVSCAIMLEVLHCLSQKSTPLQHSIIFLFNGAEENALQAAHGFITQHSWAKEVAAFVNLEACGSGGREVLFQAGPKHPWLIQAYADAAPHPFGSIVGQEIFSSGIIPSDTDYRIFRDFGHIPGLDIAYMSNGYVYHTKYDEVSRIPKGSIQRAGDNLLAVVQHITMSPQLADTSAYQHGDLVFFDFVGLFMILYPARIGQILNFLVVVFAVITTIYKVQKSSRLGLTKKGYLQHLCFAGLVQTLSWVLAIFTVITIAITLSTLGKAMTWFSRPYWIFGLYCAPTLLVVIGIQLCARQWQIQHVNNIWTIEGLYIEVSKIFFATVLLLMTLADIKSGFLAMLLIIFPAVGRTVLDKAFQHRQKDWRWMLFHLTSLLIPVTLSLYMTVITFSVFIPIMGRFGSSRNPDVFVGILASLLTIISTSYVVPLVQLLKSPGRVIKYLFGLFCATVLIVTCTPLGFPYSGDITAPKPQRWLMMHSQRTFYGKAGAIEHQNSGIWIFDWDYNIPHSVSNVLPDVAKTELVSEDCNRYMFCGMPYFFPVLSLVRHSHWLPASKPIIHHHVRMELLSQRPLTVNTRRLTFNVTGPDHMTLQLCPAPDVDLIGWSFADGEPLAGVPFQGRPTYFVFYSHGLPSGPWIFWIDLKVSPMHSQARSMMNFAITSHFLHGDSQQSPDFKAFIQRFPDWTYPIGWTSEYQHWTI